MKSDCAFFLFEKFEKDHPSNTFKSRNGEKKIGDVITQYNSAKKIKILGISESIGPIVNLGTSGAENAFQSFLDCFLHTQYNAPIFSEVTILGQIKLSDHLTHPTPNHVGLLDAFVECILTEHIEANEIPIIIGGGHNNALPIMRWLRKTYPHLPSHIVNIDAHADCRKTDHRHSGNSFSWALNENCIDHYSVFGLHEAYNNEFILQFLKEKNIFHTYFENYIFKSQKIEDDLHNCIQLHGSNLGLEIDLDAVAHFPSSAKSPSGWTVNEVRFILHEILKLQSRIFYLHLTEAGPTNYEEKKIVGKTLSYLVRDFVHFITNHDT